MTRSILGGSAAILVICSAPASAQSAPQAVAPFASAPAEASVIVPVVPQAGNAVLANGTDVRFRLLEELTTEDKRLRVGDRFRLEVAEPVVVQGATVIPVGTSAVGEITEVRNKGMWGKSGKFSARLLYLTVGGRQVRLTGEFDDKGRAGGVGAVAVSALVFLPAGFFMTGTSARLPAGTVVGGFIDENVPLALQAQAAPPPALAVSAPAAIELDNGAGASLAVSSGTR
jgi:hypothetical protein